MCCRKGQDWGVTCGGASWEGSDFKTISCDHCSPEPSHACTHTHTCMHPHRQTQAQTHEHTHALKQQAKVFLSYLTQHQEGGRQAGQKQLPVFLGCRGLGREVVLAGLRPGHHRNLNPTPPHPAQIKTNHQRLDNLLKEWPPLGGKGLLALGHMEGGRVGRKVAFGEEIMLP